MESNLPVFISIGSNLGKRHDNCLKGIEYLNGLFSTKVIEVSSFYRTEPVDYIDQNWFVNAIVEIDTMLAPEDLMAGLKSIEEKLGQFEKQVRFGPRLLDLDIVLFKNQVINTANLIVPHPRMHKRCFVLKPLCDINPEIIHPVFGKTAADLLKNIENSPDQKVIEL